MTTVWNLLKAADPAPAHGWLHWHPSQLEECLRARTNHLPEPLGRAEREELTAAHLGWEADQASLDSIDQLGRPETRVIVTGQQPALLAGPLLVVYKTAAAVRLARDLAARHPQLNFVPVFWVASEDHDFDEVRRAYWPGHEGELEEFLLSPDGVPGRMVGQLDIGHQLPRLANQVRLSTITTEFRDPILERITGGSSVPQTLENHFCRLLLELFRGTGLVIVSPLQAWVRRRSFPVFRREMERPGESSARVIGRGREMEAEGIEAQLHRPVGSLNFFWVDGDERRLALRVEDEATLRRIVPGGPEETSDTVPLAEMRERLASEPQGFSSNVVTRPLVQDSALPTVAQVVGPGEAAYLAQVEAVYEEFGVFAPIRWPRPNVILLEPRVQRRLEKHQLLLDQAMNREADELVEMILQRDLGQGQIGRIESLRARQKEELEALRRDIEASDAAGSAIDKLQQALDKGYEKLLDRVLTQHKQDRGHLTRAMALIANSLHPARQPQERALNPMVPFATNFGMEWVGRLSGSISIDPTAPSQILSLGDLMIPKD